MFIRDECPFCGKDDNETVQDPGPGPDLFFVVCNRCNGTGPGSKTRLDARQKWKERVPSIKIVNN